MSETQTITAPVASTTSKKTNNKAAAKAAAAKTKGKSTAAAAPQTPQEFVEKSTEKTRARRGAAMKADNVPALPKADKKPAVAALAPVEPAPLVNMFAGSIEVGQKTVGVTEFRNQENVDRRDGFRIDPRLIIIDVTKNPRTWYDPIKFAENKESIRLHGVRTPVQIRARKDDEGNIKYYLAQGYNRMRAVMEIIAETPDALQRIPADLVEGTEESMLMDHVILNRGAELRPIDVAVVAKQYSIWGWTPEKFAAKATIDLDTIKRYLQFSLNASDQVIEATQQERITFHAAETLVKKHKNQDVQNRKLAEIFAKQAAAEGEAAKPATAKDLGMGKLNVSKSLNEFSAFITKEKEQFPDKINTEAVDNFERVIKMVRDGKSNTEILKACFTVKK